VLLVVRDIFLTCIKLIFEAGPRGGHSQVESPERDIEIFEVVNLCFHPKGK